MEGETFAGVSFCIAGMQVNMKLPGIFCFGESVKGFLVASKLQECKALAVVHSSGVRVKEQHMYIGFKGFLIPFHLVVSIAFSEPLLFCLLKEVRHTAMRVDRVTSVCHSIVPRRSGCHPSFSSLIEGYIYCTSVSVEGGFLHEEANRDKWEAHVQFVNLPEVIHN